MEDSWDSDYSDLTSSYSEEFDESDASDSSSDISGTDDSEILYFNEDIDDMWIRDPELLCTCQCAMHMTDERAIFQWV